MSSSNNPVYGSESPDNESVGEQPPELSRASFIIQGVGLDLESITQNIGITPSHIHKKGDLIFTFKDIRYDHDMWKLTSSLEKEAPLNDHLTWLAHLLTPHYEYIKSLKAGAEVYVYCGFTTQNEQSSFSLSAEVLTAFADLCIPMHVAIHSI